MSWLMSSNLSTTFNLSSSLAGSRISTPTMQLEAAGAQKQPSCPEASTFLFPVIFCPVLSFTCETEISDTYRICGVGCRLQQHQRAHAVSDLARAHHL